MLKKAYFLVIALVLLLTITSIPSALCYPPAGTDYLDPTTATIELQITGMFDETISATGPTRISRSDPYDPGDGRMKIDTEIVFMNLTGMSINIGQIVVVESPSKASTGSVQQLVNGTDFRAESYFDVFVEINTALPSPYRTLYNDDPVFMSTKIYDIPPWGATYISLPKQTIPLKDEQGNVVGFIKHTSHVLPPRPHVGGLVFFANSVDLLAPYIGLTSMIAIVTAATAICIKCTKRKKEKQ